MQDEEIWSSTDEDEKENADTETTFHPLRYLFIFLVLWQSAFRISNAALSSLIRFLKYFLLILGRSFNLKENRIEQLADEVPLTLRSIHKSLGLDSRNWVIEYVVCPKCHSIYEYQDCVSTASGENELLSCVNVVMCQCHI